MQKINQEVNDQDVSKLSFEALMAKFEAEKAKNAAYETEKAESARIANLKEKIKGHIYGEKATELLIMRNMTPEIKDELAPPEVLVNFLKIYDLKTDDGKSRICVSKKELVKCQKLLAGGRTLESITLDEVEVKPKAKEASTTGTDTSADKEGNDVKEGNETMKPEVTEPAES